MSDHPQLISEEYLVALDNSEPSNYTMRPNIIDHLTYDELDPETGIIEEKRLSVFACHLYTVLRSIGGNENVSWKNTLNLADLANMSTGMVVKCKKELQQKFHQLDNNPLIVVSEHKKATVKDGEKINGTIYHKINIPNIWNFNRAFFILKKLEAKTRSQDARVKSARSQHERPPFRTRSPHERTNTPSSKTPLSKEQDSTADAVSVCPSDASGIVLPDKSPDATTSAFNWLLQLGYDVLTATCLSSNYTPTEISKASTYMKKQIEINQSKQKKIHDQLGYFRRVLENRWWVPKPCA